jgi:hypothetical protein
MASPTAAPLWWCVCCALFAVRRADFILDKRQDESTGSVYGVVQDDVTQVRFLLRVGPGSDDGVIVGGQFMEPDLVDEVRVRHDEVAASNSQTDGACAR